MNRLTIKMLAGASLLGTLFGEYAAAQVAALPEITVTGTREKALLNETPAAVGTIKAGTVQQDRPNHPTQIMSQIPGVAEAVTNGEGHTTSIRHPFTTNPVYLFLEDGIPIRSTGFFNHNALYEINIPQSGGIEVTRGSGTALLQRSVLHITKKTGTHSFEGVPGGISAGEGHANSCALHQQEPYTWYAVSP